MTAAGERAAEAPAKRRGTVAALVASARPRQWTKNLLVFAALVFAQKLHDPASVARSVAAFAAFLLASVAVYFVNDVEDVERDRLHPQKRLRPIAAGELSRGLALGAGLLALVGALAIAARLNTSSLVVVGGYLALQVAYTKWLKSVVLLDVFSIAAGFVLRVILGAKAIGVPVSNWLYVCTLLLSLFLALGKRRAELTQLADAAAHREILAEYSIPLIDQFVAIVAGATIVCYSLYTMSPEVVARFGHDRMKFTIPLVIYALLRYLYLVHRRGQGASPERILLSDPPLVLDLVLYIATSLWAIYL